MKCPLKKHTINIFEEDVPPEIASMKQYPLEQQVHFGGCEGDECAWFDRNHQWCALKSISVELTSLNDKK